MGQPPKKKQNTGGSAKKKGGTNPLPQEILDTTAPILDSTGPNELPQEVLENTAPIFDQTDTAPVANDTSSETTTTTTQQVAIKEEPGSEGKVPFRHRWQKNPTKKNEIPALSGHQGNERANKSTNNAHHPVQGGKIPSKQPLAPFVSSNGRGRSTRRRIIPDPDAEEDDLPNYSSHGVRIGRADEDDDRYDEDDDEADCDFDYDEAGGPVLVPSKAKKAANKSRKRKEKVNKTPHPNGRIDGRSLVLWHRPRMVEKLLLHLIYESHLQGMKLPWAAAVERLNPGSSGMCAVQHLHKLRDILITEGHLVPPLMGKKTKYLNTNVRGFVRDMDGPFPTSVRSLGWDEEYPHRDKNLDIDGIIHGSGNYNRENKVKRGRKPKVTADADGTRQPRNGTQVEQENTETSSTPTRRITRNTRKAAEEKSKKIVVDEDEENEDEDDDDEYDPANGSDVEKKKTRVSPRKRKATSYVEESDDEAEESDNENVDPRGDALGVTLRLPTFALEQFPSGSSAARMTGGLAENSPVQASNASPAVLSGKDITGQQAPSTQVRAPAQTPVAMQSAGAAIYRQLPEPFPQTHLGTNNGSSPGAFGQHQTMPQLYNQGHGTATNFTFQAGASRAYQLGGAPRTPGGSNFQASPAGGYQAGSTPRTPGYRSGAYSRYQSDANYMYGGGNMRGSPSMNSTGMAYGGGSNAYGMNANRYSSHVPETMAYSYTPTQTGYSTPYRGLGPNSASPSGFGHRSLSNNNGTPFTIASDQTATPGGTEHSPTPTRVAARDPPPVPAGSVDSSRFNTAGADKENLSEQAFIAMMAQSGNNDEPENWDTTTDRW